VQGPHTRAITWIRALFPSLIDSITLSGSPSYPYSVYIEDEDMVVLRAMGGRRMPERTTHTNSVYNAVVAR